MEFIIEVLGIIIFGIPGGFIRWFIFRRKPLKEYITDDPYINILPVIAIIIVVAIVKYCIAYYKGLV